MKQYEYESLSDEDRLSIEDLANIFHVQVDRALGPFMLTYNVNRTFNIVGTDNPSTSLFDVHVANDEDTWTGISFRYYNTTRLWWLVCKMNGVKDPTSGPTVGSNVKVLKEEYVRDVLRSIKLS